MIIMDGVWTSQLKTGLVEYDLKDEERAERRIPVE